MTTPPTALRRVAAPALFCLTLGLAPFRPEPHVVGKLRWVAGGAEGMAWMDWADLAMHGAPWIWLAAAIALGARDALRSGAEPPPG